ncbi:MAG: hypothetical protein R3291_01050, partial [Thermoplasmata archaeon]|nr:hypothetical protein [Thermoplasmata archaeon]
AVREASEIFQRIGEERKIGWSYLYEGSIAYLRGDEGKAEEAWETGLRSLNALHDHRGVALFQLTIATDYFENGDLVAGLRHLEQAERSAKKIDNQAILERIAEERAQMESIRKGETVPTGAAVRRGTRSGPA